MVNSGADGELLKRIQALERENRLLQIGVRQLTRIRTQWTQSLDELKATKSRLQVSNQFLDRLLRTAPLPVLVLTRPWARVTMANAAAEMLAGVAAGRLTERSMLRLLAPASRRDLLRQFASSTRGACGPISTCLTFRSGEQRDLDLHWAELAAGAGQSDRLIVIAQDVTDRRAAEQRLRLASRIIESAPQGVVVLDRDHRIVSINPAGAALRGSPACQLTGRSAAILLRPEDGQAIERVLKQTESGLEQWQGEMRFMRQDGLSYPTWVDVLTLKHADEQLSNFILQFTDITDRKQTEDRLRHQSLHDILTGLPNRRLFRDHLDRAISLCQQGPFKVGVLFLDLDGFKHVNDAFGHDNGDELLRQVAGRLRGVLRATDTLARFGGDEFAAVLPGVREVGNLEAVARTVIDAVRPPYHLEGGTCEISVSAGISVYPDDAGDVETLMKYADMAMYRVKAGGKNTYRFFTPDLDIEATKRMTLIGRMQEALERGEFVVHYQPQVDIASRRIVGVEALVRWNDPVDGLVAPAAFIGLAEETGFIDALGGFVLEVACRQIAAWARDGIDGISLSVNLSARQFCASSLATTIRRAIEKSGIDPARLVLEVTETTVIEDMATAQRILDHLLGLGVRFALDDFGTGYASLAFLKRLAFSQLKIDRQFVNDLETDPRDVAIATAIIRMAGALGMEVVAEGVETDGQLRLLEGLSCDQAQGYLFARPMAAAQCRDMLLAARRCESLLEAASAL